MEKFNLNETYFLKVLTVHFEGISGKRHRTNVSYVSDNVSFSWSPVLGTAEVAGFWPGVRAKPSNVLIIVNLCHSMDIYTS